MAKLIDKDALVEELKILKQNLSASPIVVIEDVESLVESLEVKEVDLIKEVANWKIDHQVYGMDETFYDFAKHFFELGVKAKQG